MKSSLSVRLVPIWIWMSVAAAVLAIAPAARAEVKLDGEWGGADKTVALDLEGLPRSKALERLADAAGWSLIVSDAPTDTVTLHLKDQPARKVLGILLAQGTYVATRDGDLVSIRREEAASSPAVPVPPIPAIPAVPSMPALPAIPAVPPPPSAPNTKQHGEDRMVTGGNLRLGPEEVAHDVSVYGGNADIEGTVTGDLSIMGGKGRVRKAGHVLGNATLLGGSLRLDDGARIDGEATVLGGRLDRAVGATVGGTTIHAGGDDEEEHASAHEPEKKEGILHEMGGAVTRSALLFVFGAVLLALGGKRMEMLRAEAAVRPMRSFALGVVGSIAAVALVVALCVTLVGIPVAIVGLLLAVVAGYAGVAAVLTTAGEALLRHRTESSYVHLAAGCALLMVVGAIPVVGNLVRVALVLVGIGVLIATRGAGLFPPRAARLPAPPSDAPYRTP
jgi:hypothetical protein